MKYRTPNPEYLVVFRTRSQEGLVGMAYSPAGASRMMHDFIVEHFPLEGIDAFEIRVWVKVPLLDFGGQWVKHRTIPVTKSMQLHRRSARKQGGEEHGEAA